MSTEAGAKAQVLKVFTSYTHDTPAHSKRVLNLSNALREAGFDSDIDQYHVNEDWPAWMERIIAWADHVLVMESWMKKILAERYPEFASKVELLRGFARMRGNLNIADDDPDAGAVTEKRVMTACRQVYAAVNRAKRLNLL